MDSRMKEERETIAEILELTKKKPYPTKETVHLARFVNSCFYVIENVKREELLKKKEEERKRKQKEEEQRRQAEALAKQKELEAMAPSPNPAKDLPPLLNIPTLQQLGLDIPSPEKTSHPKREYVLQVYNNQIGILVEKEQDGSYEYKVIEPHIDTAVIEKAKDMYGKEFERDSSLFDSEPFLKRVAEKVTNKLKLPFSEILPQQIHYYLERDLLGAGVFDPLLYDEKIKAIICEGPNKNIKIDYADLGIMTTNRSIANNEELNHFIKKLARTAGKKITEQNPFLDITFEGLKFEGTIGMGGRSSEITIKRVDQ